MLVSFSVSNFRSIGEEITLNMVASGRLTDHPSHLVKIPGTDKSVVRTAVMYGANAAGKSNVIKAMKYAQSLLQQRTESHLPSLSVFKFNETIASQPSTFEFRFVVSDTVFIYGMDVSSDVIEEEWLAVLDGGKETVVFSRDKSGAVDVDNSVDVSEYGDSQFQLALQFISFAPLRLGQLALRRVLDVPAEFAGTTLTSIVQWLVQDLVILDNSEDACEVLIQIAENARLQKVAKEFLRTVDTGIDNLLIDEEERAPYAWEEEQMKMLRRNGITEFSLPFSCGGYVDVQSVSGVSDKVLERRLSSVHSVKGMDFKLEFSEESDGTRLLLKYIPILCPSKLRACTYVIDELDGSLHPTVCREFIKAFAESCPDRNRQLIVTTHEAHLLDQDLLRRDEYWFVEKDDKQQTRLTSLSDFNVRNDLQLRKGYLQGRFGGIPVLGSDERLRKLLQCEALEEDQHSVVTAGGASDAP